jgi:hypothetical protein
LILHLGIRRAVAAVVAVAAAASVGAYLADRGNSTPAADRYGQLPSWLPSAKVPVGRLVTATAAEPRLAVQGDTVAVRLPRGMVLATLVGPVVPEEGEFPVPETSRCTFTVTFTSASGVVPLGGKAFTIVDELGHVHDPVVTARGGGPVPARVPPGRTVTLTVTDVLPTGDGGVRWSPQGAKPIVAWDFDVEID